MEEKTIYLIIILSSGWAITGFVLGWFIRPIKEIIKYEEVQTKKEAPPDDDDESVIYISDAHESIIMEELES